MVIWTVEVEKVPGKWLTYCYYERDDHNLSQDLRFLRRVLHCNGSIMKSGVLVLQGRHKEYIKTWLTTIGVDK